LDPDEVADGYENPDALRAGYSDGYYNDNAGVEQHGNHPDYAHGMELGQEAADDERQNPHLYREPTDIDAYSAKKTAEAHPPYYIREDGGKHKVIDAIGDVRGSFETHGEALKQQKALYANVPGAAQKAKAEHGHTPEAVQEVGPKSSVKTAMPQRWSHWDGNALYDHDGNKLGHVTRAEEGTDWHAAIPAGHAGRLSVMGTHPSREKAMQHVQQLVDSSRVAAKTANQYIHEENPGDWVITQKGTGDILSHHDSQEKAQSAFEAMESHMHGSRRRQYGYLQDGVFHATAVNEDAYGADRYEHVSAPATPGWINDQLSDGHAVELGDTPVENNADGDELKPTAPWLVREEVRTRTYAHPMTVSADAENPFMYSGPGNPGNPPAPVDGDGMPAPIVDDSQIGVMPDAASTPPDTSLSAPDSTNPSLSDMPAADGSDLDAMPSSLGDDSSTLPATTSARYTAPMDSVIDRIASQVMAANPGMSLRACVRLAERTVGQYPELVRA
jgi:hypothetical protein